MHLMIPNRIYLSLTALSLCAAATAAFAQTTPMSMQQAVDQALARNPALLSAQQNVQSVRAQELQAGTRQNPYLVLGGSNTTLGEYANNPFAYTAGVGRLFERGEKRRWRLDVAKSTTLQTESQYHTQEQQTILAVRDAFSSLVLAKAAKKLADDNLADYRKELGIAGDRMKAGDIAKLDYERLDLQLAQFESDESTAATNQQQASIQLQTLLGIAHPTLDFDVVGEVVPPAVADTMDGLEQKALAARPDLKAAQYGVTVADANVKLAYANGTTDPTAEIDYNRNGPDNSVGFSFNIPLRLFDKNQGNKKTAEFSAQASRFILTAAQNQVVSDVQQGWFGYVNARKLAERYNGHYLDEAKDVLDIAKFSYDHGGIALIDYLDAIRDYRSVTSDALNAYGQAWSAIHQLSYVTATNVAP